MVQAASDKSFLVEENTAIKKQKCEMELDTLISSIAAGVLIYDNFGNIVRMNKVAEEVFGYTTDDFNIPYQVRLRNLDLRKPDGKPYADNETPLHRALHGETIRNEEIMINRDPEKQLWLSFNLSPIVDNNNNTFGVIYVFDDITQRKRIEEALKKSEHQYRTLSENTPNFIARFDRNLCYLYINEYGAKFHGRPKEDIIGNIYGYNMPPDREDYFRQYFELVFATGKLQTVEFADNSLAFGYQYYSSLFVPEYNNEGEIISVLVITREITEHRRYELECEEAIMRLHGLLKVTEIASSLLEPREATQRAMEYLVEYHGIDFTNVWLASGGSLQMVAYTNFPLNSPIPFSASYDADRVHFTGTPVVVPDAARSNPAAFAWHAEMGVELGAYVIVPLRSRGQIIGSLNFGWYKPRSFSIAEVDYYTSIGNELGIILENVRIYEAEKRRTEELGKLRNNLEKLVDKKTQELQALNSLLRQSEQQHREIIEVSPDAYFIWTDNKIVYANPAALLLFGTERIEEIDSDLLKNIVTPERYDEFKAFLKKCDKTHHPFQLGEFTFSKEAGTQQVIVDITVIHIIFEGQKAYQFIVRDITRRKEMENEMARLDRLNVVGEMAAGIGHEVRNPMTSVRGFLQLMANKEQDPEKSEYYSIMIEELDRANSIITEFLSLAKDRAVKFTPASLNSIINSLYPLLSADAAKQDKSILLKKGDIPTLLLNEKEIRQLIINLVRNGMEAMPAEGWVTIGTYDDKDEVVLYVEDEGTGIDPEVYKKLGTPFVTTKEKGTGLGLSICYSIANKHNAKIDVKTSSAGTTFYVRFNKVKLTSGGALNSI